MKQLLFIAVVLLSFLPVFSGNYGNPTCPDDGASMMWVGTDYRNTYKCRTVQIYQCLMCQKRWAFCQN